MGDFKKSFYFFLCTTYIVIFAALQGIAQYERIGTLDYNTATLSVIGNTAVPGVTWVEIFTAFDQNHKWFFFMGQPADRSPYSLYTIDGVTGATIYSALCPPAGTNGIITEMQYDDKTDTLYAIYFDRINTVYFCWIDPASGKVNQIAALPGFSGSVEATFDLRDHIFITNNGLDLVGINASTGAIVFNWPGTAITHLKYDNQNGKLYGIKTFAGTQQIEFDSVSLSTGIIHHIADLPYMYFPELNAFAIDEHAGRFIFVGETPPSGACVTDSLYVLDISTGSIISRSKYKWTNSTALNLPNVLGYSFDNKSGKLYTLNWSPPNSLGTTITQQLNSFCANATNNFTVQPFANVQSPFYQWQVNNKDAGNNSISFSSNTLMDGDSVRCIITDNAPCAIIRKDSSNNVPVVFSANLKASVYIDASATAVCNNQQIIFNAHSTNTGPHSVFQWQVNGINVGTNDSTYATTANASDSVTCIILPNTDCVFPEPDTSNAIAIHVIAAINTSLSIAASTTSICSGDTIVFYATPKNAGNEPAYNWLVNGINTGTNTDTFVTGSLGNEDVVSCMISPSSLCALPVTSTNNITVTVKETPTIIFSPDTLVIKPGDKVMINPRITGNPSNYSWFPVRNLQDPAVPDPVADPEATTIYELTAGNGNGCTTSAAVTVLVYAPLEMPSAFTPDHNGKNDIFRIPPSTHQMVKSFTVFNRWGQMVFHAGNNSEGWDGTYNHQPQPGGTYVWEISYENLFLKQEAVEKGTVVLVR